MVTSDSTDYRRTPGHSPFRIGSPESPGKRSEQSSGSDTALQAACHSGSQTKREGEGEEEGEGETGLDAASREAASAR